MVNVSVSGHRVGRCNDQHLLTNQRAALCHVTMCKPIGDIFLISSDIHNEILWNKYLMPKLEIFTENIGSSFYASYRQSTDFSCLKKINYSILIGYILYIFDIHIIRLEESWQKLHIWRHYPKERGHKFASQVQCLNKMIYDLIA